MEVLLKETIEVAKRNKVLKAVTVTPINTSGQTGR